MRNILDGIYMATGWLAAIFMVGTLAMVLAGVLGRVMDFQLPGTDSYAGFCMAATFFLSLAHTFVKGEHIRVSLILERLTSRKLRVLEALCHLLGTVIAWLLAGFSIHLAWTSYELNDISQGMDEMPLWIPQIAMALGSVVLAVALTDRLCGVLFDRHWQPQRSDLTFSE